MDLMSGTEALGVVHLEEEESGAISSETPSVLQPVFCDSSPQDTSTCQTVASTHLSNTESDIGLECVYVYSVSVLFVYLLKERMG